MKKFGFLGGAFDPIHRGHIRFAKQAMEQLDLDRVLLVPSYRPPHKKEALQATNQQRTEMCLAASKDIKWLQISTIEVRHQLSYTADTLHLLLREHPDVEWTLLLGEDAFCFLPNWKAFHSICSMAALATIRRWPDAASAAKLEAAVRKLQNAGASVTVLSGSPDTLSSTEVRYRISSGRPLKTLMPPAVEQYISENKLYRAKAVGRKNNE
jgi:nicotinate-nucleotide adenylyltransferase